MVLKAVTLKYLKYKKQYWFTFWLSKPVILFVYGLLQKPWLDDYLSDPFTASSSGKLKVLDSQSAICKDE